MFVVFGLNQEPIKFDGLLSHFNRGFRTECRGGEIKPEFRPDLPPLGLFKFVSDFYMGVPCPPGGGAEMLFCRAHISFYRDSG